MTGYKKRKENWYQKTPESILEAHQLFREMKQKMKERWIDMSDEDLVGNYCYAVRSGHLVKAMLLDEIRAERMAKGESS